MICYEKIPRYVLFSSSRKELRLKHSGLSLKTYFRRFTRTSGFRFICVLKTSYVVIVSIQCFHESARSLRLRWIAALGICFFFLKCLNSQICTAN